MGKTNRFSKAIEGTGMEKFLSRKHNTKMQLGFEAVYLDLDFTAPAINSPRLSSLFTFFLYRLRNKGILTYWLGFLPYWNDEKP